MKRLQVWCALAALAAGTATLAQAYPDHPMRVVVPYAPGGNTDIVARTIARKLSDNWGQQVVVDNRAGGATNIGSDMVAKALPVGYTILMDGASNAINMTLFSRLPYDTLRDFAPVILVTTGANVMVVNPSVPAKNLKELIALAKAKPGSLNFGSSGLGSSNQLAGELFKLMAGVDITHVPYKGNSPAITDAVGGQIQILFAGVTSLVPFISAGKLRAIAIGSKQRFSALPEVPTVAESGLPGYEAITWFGFMVPAKTPKAIVTKWNTEVGKILATPDVRERLVADGQEPGGGTPEEFGAFVRSEIAKYAKVIKAAGLRAD